MRDEQIVALMVAERDRQKLVKRFGARKMWLHLRGKGHDVARCTIELIYAEAGWAGATRTKAIYDLLSLPASLRFNPISLEGQIDWQESAPAGHPGVLAE